MIYVAAIRWIGNVSPLTILGYADTKEEAQAYISEKNEGTQPSGLGVDVIIEIPKLK